MSSPLKLKQTRRRKLPFVTASIAAALLWGSTLLAQDAEPLTAVFDEAPVQTNAIVTPDDAVPSDTYGSEAIAPVVVPPPEIVAEPLLPAVVPAAPKPKAPPVFPGPKVLPPTGPWKPLFYNNDFSFIAQPDHNYVPGEELKNRNFCLGDLECVFSTGGELRHRYMNEDNRLRPGGPIHSANSLWRWRHYFDLKVDNRVRVYLESIDAVSIGEEAPVQAIDENRWDLLNAFIEAQLFEFDDISTHARIGRQELLFGRQRFVSPLDWANTRRNFEGVRAWMKGPDWNFDTFYVNPVNSATGFRSVTEFDHRFDQPNYDVHFTGTYFTYTGLENTTLDLYWMLLDTEVDVANRPDGRRHTIGSRLAKLFPVTEGGETTRVWDLDLEGAFQIGRDNNEAVQAGFVTGILGHTWKSAPWSPRLSGLFYWGSGDTSNTDNDDNTVNIPFPLGHAYWGISDNLVGQNLGDAALQFEVKPTAKTALVGAWHYFSLVSGQDTAYNVAGAPVGTPGNGLQVGNALDLYGYYALNQNIDIQCGQSWFWYGEYIQNVAPREDAQQFYFQTTVRY